MLGVSLLEVTNFRSFVDTHTWVLNRGPGLFHLSGVNHENDRLQSNGCGKSSLLDAICWCLYDRTTRFLRGNDVVNYGASGCRVRVDAQIRGNTDTIIRTRNPNSLTLNGHIIDQETLTKHIGLNLESFLYAVIIPQFGEAFLDLKPSAKLTLFSDMMELDHWLDLSHLADTEAKALETKISNANRGITLIEGKKQSTLSIMEELKAKTYEWINSRRNEVERIKKEIIEHQEHIKTLNEEKKNYEAKAKDINTRIEDLEDKIKRSRGKRDTLETDIRETDIAISLVTSFLGQLNQKLIRFDVVGAKCPTCYQQVDSKHLVAEKAKCNHEITKARKELEESSQVKDELEKESDDHRRAVNELELNLNDRRVKLNKTRNVINDIMTEVKYLDREVDKLFNLLEQEPTNEFEKLLQIRTKEISDFEKQLKTKADEVAKLNENYSAVSYWVKGFKEIRLSIVEETLRSLEIEVNNNLASMGLVDWTIEFDIERENKKGGITKGFITLIKDGQGRTVEYETLSGGEGQRVRLAASLGLANLIMERAGLVSQTEFYDEISQHLSADGIDDVLNTLRDRAINRQIWVVDHHSLAYPDFKGVTVVLKDENGSRIMDAKELF